MIRPKVYIRLNGGFGNQLFQFAAAHEIEERLSRKVIFVKDSFENKLEQYLESKRGPRTDALLLNQIVSENLFIVDRPLEADIWSFLDATSNDVLLMEDYYQSPGLYFPSVAHRLSRLVRINKKNRLNREGKRLVRENNTSAILHFRRREYKFFGNEEVGKDLTLPLEYYRASIKELKRIGIDKLIVVSDDQTEVRDILKNETSFRNAIFFEGSEIEDFQMLQNGTCLCISNSTFAWWAAFLNTRSRYVFVPEFWFGFRVKKTIPTGIFHGVPEHWNRVKFE